MNKKLLALILATVMVFAMAFVSCTQAPVDETPVSGEENVGAETNTDETNNEETADKADFKVGVIHIGNPSDGAGYSYAHDQGIVAMQQNLGFTDDQIVRKLNIADADANATKTAIEECIEEGCNIIFGTSWGYMNTMEELAAEYPEVIFSHGTGYKSNDTNFNNYFGRIYQPRYLSGIAAGLKTQSNLVGYVAAWGEENAEVTGGLDAFAKGVAAVNPDAKVYVKVTGSWFDPTLEANAAQALLDLGCDVIGQHCDTTAPQLAAEAAGVWGCGYNTDMSKDAPKAHLTAPIWNWGVYYTAATEAAMNGTWKEFGNFFGGLDINFVDISPLSENCAEGTDKYIASARQAIVDGSFAVFDGKQLSFDAEGNATVIDEALVDNAGNEIVAAGGACLDDATITGAINWYYANVEKK
ncbi:MAG: BMP family ABC transporter substrate-binding protein [Ruminococcaceae bacterium]|nr:BMP family ABC transporter substrate-binding protein [Oscillospiraceae bacterium]